MRKVAPVSDDPSVARLILYASSEGVYVFPCASTDDGSAVGDEWYESLADADEACTERYGIDPADWEPIDDPLPGCQHDWVDPVRVVGRNEGSPRWGRFERLEGGAWVELGCVDGVWQPRPDT